MHPTAANPRIQHRFAPPFVFLVTGLPEDFRKWLVSIGIHEVKSHLKLLFVENGEPVPHDYAVTLANYNIKTTTEVLREAANQIVRRSITDFLFDKPSETSKRFRDFISTYRDNLSDAYSNSEAQAFVRDSVRVTSMDIVVPGTKILLTVYNVYIHPPTANPEVLKRWRDFIATQKYYADIYGVGIRYAHMWNCLHCKAIDHPSGLCNHAQNVKGKATRQPEALTAEELLPLGPTPDSPRNPQNPTRDRQNNPERGNPNARTRTRGTGNPTRGNAVRTIGSKKRKIN